MNLQQLKIMVLIAEHKKITAVAEVMNLKQPTVTFHMKKLEQYAGLPLFVMKHKKVFITDAGNALLHYARRIVSWADEAELVLDDYRQLKKGKVTIGASNTPAIYFLPKLIGKMQELYPHIDISLHVQNSPQIVDMLKNFEIDFGMAAEHHIDDPDLIAKPLYEDELGLVMPPAHPLGKADPIPVGSLSEERWILREKGSASRRMMEEWAMQHHMEFKATLELGATEAIKQAVMAKLGISILSRLAVNKEVSEGTLVFKKLPSPLLTRNIFLIYNRNRFITPLIRNFISFFEQHALVK